MYAFLWHRRCHGKLKMSPFSSVSRWRFLLFLGIFSGFVSRTASSFDWCINCTFSSRTVEPCFFVIRYVHLRDCFGSCERRETLSSMILHYCAGNNYQLNLASRVISSCPICNGYVTCLPVMFLGFHWQVHQACSIYTSVRGRSSLISQVRFQGSFYGVFRDLSNRDIRQYIWGCRSRFSFRGRGVLGTQGECAYFWWKCSF